jgi:hypothetical protein
VFASEVDAGSYVVRAAAPGVGTGQSDTITIDSTTTYTSGNPYTVPAITIAPRQFAYHFTVVDGNGDPVPGATVSMNDGTTETANSPTDSGDGTATVSISEAAPSRAWTVHAPNGWVGQTGTRTALDSASLTVTLHQAAAMTGTVMNGATAQAGATVYLCKSSGPQSDCAPQPLGSDPAAGTTPPDANVIAVVKTDSNGVYTIPAPAQAILAGSTTFRLTAFFTGVGTWSNNNTPSTQSVTYSSSGANTATNMTMGARPSG